jgi:hypothetical protein
MAGEIQLNSTTFATESGGTVTVSNVDSATNRTNLGLGSIATQAADSVSISGGNITGGTIGSGVTFPAGHILQTTQNTYNSGDSATSNSATTAKVSDGASNYYWSHTISGMTAGNDVLVNFSFVGAVIRNSTTAGGAWHIYRDSDIIYGSSQDFMQYISVVGATSVQNYSYINLIFLDTGATATSHTYYLGYSSNGGSTDVVVRSNSVYPPFIAILQEIKS